MHALRLLRMSLLLLALGLLPHIAWAKAITIGSVTSSEPAAEVKKFLPLARYLASQLNSEGIEQGKVVVVETVRQMADLLREGKVDLYIDSAFPVMAASRLAGSKPLLRRWKRGIGEYHSVIFTRKESGIDRLEDLRGKMIGFEGPSSTSGYLLPKVILQERGLRPTAKTAPSEPVTPREVGYVFTGDDENTMVWVLRGKISAGAMDNQTYLRRGGRDVESLKILYKSSSMPRHIVSHRADLDPALLARIKQLLIRMDQSEEGRKALQDFEKTTKFDELSEELMAPLLKLQPFVDAEIGIR